MRYQAGVGKASGGLTPSTPMVTSTPVFPSLRRGKASLAGLSCARTSEARAIADAAVLPSPDEKAGEVPIAFVVLKHSTTAAEIIDYVAERVASYKKIRRVEFIDHIPKSPAGKILRRVLTQRVRQEVRSNEEGKGD